jgi:glycyl-tRNA synthetase beta chain
MAADLLLEIGTEDLPARYVVPLADALAAALRDGLARRGVALGETQRYATPRRIAALLREVSPVQAEQQIERRGPSVAAAFKNGEPTPAALGFARSCGVELAALTQENGQLVFRRSEPGRATIALLPDILEDALKQMDELVPKRMRWGDGDETFVRPVQWLLALLGDEVVPLRRFGLTAGRLSYGHRFHAPAAITLASPADYAQRLRDARVWAEPESRREEIRRQVLAQAQVVGGHARITDDLLEEVAALVEWPVAVAGNIEPRFLEMPPEVIVSTVEVNQRYFTVFEDTACTRLLPHFITVANIESRDVSQIISGNERVVRPRLTDALFFWEQDLRRPLEAFVPELDRVTFQKQLGSIGDKARRIAAIVGSLAETLHVDPAPVRRAASLCKADLATKMVYEFPELQGLMGGYYAARSGEPEAVATAIRDHYLPVQAGTPIPSTMDGRLVALADKLDTLAGIFAIGQKPSASKDPFGLRRAALGCLRICIEGELPLDLAAAFDTALALQPVAAPSGTGAALWDFAADRLRAWALDHGATPEQFDAVRATGTHSPLDFERRLAALRAFAGSEAAASLAAADKRARNILRQAGAAPGASVEAARFEHDAERALLGEIEAVEAALQPQRAQAAYGAMLGTLAALKTPVDAFFDSVMVMAEDPDVRANRLALLARLDALCREVADLACLPG